VFFILNIILISLPFFGVSLLEMSMDVGMDAFDFGGLVHRPRYGSLDLSREY
jgi:hypothetical protein